MAIGPFETSDGPPESATAPDGAGSEEPEPRSPDAPSSIIQMHPRHAENLQRKTEDLIAAYERMKVTALDLIDHQIGNLSDGEHGLPPDVATLVIAKLAETRIKILALTPTKPEAGEALVEFMAEIRALVRQTDS